MTSVTFPPAIGGDGSTVSDDSSPTTGLGNGGHKTRFVPALAQLVAIAQYISSLGLGIPNSTWAPVRAATTANITLSGTQTVDGVALVVGNRCLVRAQTTASQNGIYVVASGAWTRATDADLAAEFTAGKIVCVQEGTVSATTAWLLTTTGSITLGTTSLAFERLPSLSDANTWTGSQTFSAASPIISAKIGPSSGQQHTVPAVTSDTLALLAAAQTLTNKTLTSPTINTPTISGGSVNNAPIGATTPHTGAFTTLSTTGAASLASAAVAGVLSLALGSAAAPSLAFTGDLNTGIYSPGADQLGISTAGSIIQKYNADNSQESAIVGFSGTYPDFKCRAFVKFVGTGTVSISAAGNVSSVTDNAVGTYTVNFTTAMPDINYCTQFSNAPDSSSNYLFVNAQPNLTAVAPTTTATLLGVRNSAGSAADISAGYAAFFR